MEASLLESLKINAVNIPSIIPKKVFSFSLFCNENSIKNALRSLNFLDHNNNRVSINIFRQWIEKYPKKQIEGVKNLFKLKKWSEYGVIFLIDEDILDLNLPELNLREYFLNSFKDYLDDKVIILSYNFDNPQYKYNIKVSEDGDVPRSVWSQETFNLNITFAGTLVRYLPFTRIIIDDEINLVFDEVFIRDAHNTLPSRNGYDADWRDAWLESDKKIMMYTGIFYNPQHSYGAKVPFAATFSVRRMEGEDMIFEGYEFLKYFDMKANDGKKFLTTNLYGIDERIMLKFITLYKNRKNNVIGFIDDTLLVGITWLLYLFQGQIAVRNFQTLDPNYITPYNNSETDIQYLDMFGIDAINGMFNIYPAPYLGGTINIRFTDNLPDDYLNETDKVYDELNQEIGVVSKKYNNQSYDVRLSMLVYFFNYAKNAIDTYPLNVVSQFIYKPSIIYRNFDTNILPSYNYFEDLRCVVKYVLVKIANKKYKKKYKLVKIKDFFDFTEKIQYKASKKPKENRTILENLILMIPSRYHIWDLLFESNVNESTSMLDRLNFFGKFSFDNLCDINEKYFIGEEFNFDKYLKGGVLPKNINSFPKKHPLINNTSLLESSTILSDVLNLAKINFSDKDVGKKIEEITQQGVYLLTKGGSGEIYKTKVNKLLLKIVNLCSKPESKTCKEVLEGNQTITIPPTDTNKIATTLLPEYFSEIVISELLTSLYRERKIDNFMHTYGCYFDNTNKRILMAIEEISGKTGLDFLFVKGESNEFRFQKILKFLLVTLSSLYLAQKYARYTHYDLHLNNIMMNERKDEFNFFLSDRYLSIPSNFLSELNEFPVIIDFGNSVASMENDDDNIRLDIKPKLKDDFTNNFYSFSPTFDMMTLFLNILANWQSVVLAENRVQNTGLMANFDMSFGDFFNILNSKGEAKYLVDFINIFFETDEDTPFRETIDYIATKISCWSKSESRIRNVYKPNLEHLNKTTETRINSLKIVILTISNRLELPKEKRDDVYYFGEEASSI